MKNKTFLLVSHDSGTPGGPVDKLSNYLKKRNTVYTIKHPLNPTSKLKSIIVFGKKKITSKLPPSIQYATEGVYTAVAIKRAIKRISPIDVAVCFDPLAFTNIDLFRDVLHIKKIIYYNLDYSKNRFQNPVMNKIYTTLNKRSYKKCDVFFSLRDEIIHDLDPQKIYTYKACIVGQTVAKVKTRVKKIPNSIVYAGAIGKSIDFEPLLNALKRLKKNNTDFLFHIYGTENDKGKLRKNISDFDLAENITLKGSIDVAELTTKILPRYQIGVSPYMSKKKKGAPDYLFQGSVLAAKVVDYIAAGLPVIATRINPAFDEIETHKFGYLAETTTQWTKAITRLLTDKKTYNAYEKNAKKYADRFDENKVFTNAFKKVM